MRIYSIAVHMYSFGWTYAQYRCWIREAAHAVRNTNVQLQVSFCVFCLEYIPS